MAKVTNVCVYGLEESVAASKYPKSVDTESCTSEITRTVNKLANCVTGTGHDQFLTGIIVQFNLTFSVKAWVEAERYHFFDFVSSQSTMHKISSFDIRKQCNEYVTENTINEVNRLIDEYNNAPESEKAVKYLTLLYNIPTGFELTARMTTNYRQLKTIYQQRKAHRLPDWKVVCNWIETLPHSEFITGNIAEV